MKNAQTSTNLDRGGDDTAGYAVHYAVLAAPFLGAAAMRVAMLLTTDSLSSVLQDAVDWANSQ
jgi:hypothetical protein